MCSIFFSGFSPFAMKTLLPADRLSRVPRRLNSIRQNTIGTRSAQHNARARRKTAPALLNRALARRRVTDEAVFLLDLVLSARILLLAITTGIPYHSR